MTKSLALDASLTNCGWSLWQNNDYLLSGQFQPQGDDWIDKIQSIARWLYAVSMKHRLAYLFYEKPTGKSGNLDTDRKLGALLYAAMLFCRYHHVEFVEVYPSQVKATGFYKVFDTKTKQVDLMRLNTINLYTGNKFALFSRPTGTLNQAQMKRQDDEIDAIGCGLAGLEKIKNGC